MFALDTNTLIYFFKGEGQVAERLLATQPTQIAVPAIVLYELYFGIAKSTSPKRRIEQLHEMMEKGPLVTGTGVREYQRLGEDA